jgi:uncharacterized membrane protein
MSLSFEVGKLFTPFLHLTKKLHPLLFRRIKSSIQSTSGCPTVMSSPLNAVSSPSNFYAASGFTTTSLVVALAVGLT